MIKRFLAAVFCLAAGAGLACAQEGPASVFSDPTASDCPPRIWGGAEYLLWWVRSNNLSTPVLSTSTDPFATAGGFNVSGGIGRPGTVVVVGPGGQNLDYGALSGTRLTLGAWLNREATVGIEASGFLLQQGSFHSTLASNGAGLPISANPFIDVTGLNGGGENAITQSFPGTFAGYTTVDSKLTLWGAEANGVFNLSRSQPLVIDGLAGFRYMSLNDQVIVTHNTTSLLPTNGGGGVAFAGNFFDGMTTGIDNFRARNDFYGGQIGARVQANMGQAFVRLTTKVALGSTHETLSIQGISYLQSQTGIGTAVGGTYALPSNIGVRSRNNFAVLPELDLKLGYNITSRIRSFVGYNFLYLSDVARSGDQFDRRIDVRQVPTLPTYDPTVRAAFPAPQFHSTDFWAQGVTAGVEFRY